MTERVAHVVGYVELEDETGTVMRSEEQRMDNASVTFRPSDILLKTKGDVEITFNVTDIELEYSDESRGG